MDLPVLTRVAYDGPRRVTFHASVLAAATTKRPSAVRWTELTVYRIQERDEEPPRGNYVVARVGRSVVAHRRSCQRTDTRGLTQFRMAPEQGRPMPCLECHPPLDSPSDDVVLERTKHQLIQARDPDVLVSILLPRRTRRALTGMTDDAIRQLCTTDDQFADWWTGHVVRTLTEE